MPQITVGPRELADTVRTEWRQFAQQQRLQEEPTIIMNMLLIQPHRPTWFVNVDTSTHWFRIRVDSMTGAVVEREWSAW